MAFDEKKNKQLSVVIKPAGSFCNLRCDYCFYLDKHLLYEGMPATHRMSHETMEIVIKDMFACSDMPTFIWHGGEPTMLGLDFFLNAAFVQRSHAQGRRYSNALQSNGTLLNQAWADFLKKENFLVGISLDGVQQVHDQHRKDLHRKGTFHKVFENAKLLLNKNVPVNVMAAVNSHSVHYVEQTYNFFKKNGFTFMQFMPVVETDPSNQESAAPYSVTAKEYGAFLCHLFDLWLKDFDFKHLKQKTSIRFFDSIVKKYANMLPDHCIFQKICGNALVIEHNGDIFSCDYLVSDETKIGNIHEMSIEQALESQVNKNFGLRKSKLHDECNKCQWLDLCYGGCVKDRIRDPRDKGQNHFCESYKLFFTKTDKDFRKLAQLYKNYYLS